MDLELLGFILLIIGGLRAIAMSFCNFLKTFAKTLKLFLTVYIKATQVI